jgi:protein-L-isoaspartate(D-aspartate) O-methyltransferase
MGPLTNSPISIVPAIICFALANQLVSQERQPYAEDRDRMVADIVALWSITEGEIGGRAPDGKVLEVMGKVPRHEFVGPSQIRNAYANRPLPIGHGQTISQPYIVALMTTLAGVNAQSRVLELGTGSGYQAAVLAELVSEVYTIEIIAPLAESASNRLGRLGYENVTVRHGDGYHGWKEHAPFDAVLVTAAASHIPPPLVDQLAVGGKMVIPVGSAFAVQQLVLVEKLGLDRVRVRQILPVRFVPLTGEH